MNIPSTASEYCESKWSLKEQQSLRWCTERKKEKKCIRKWEKKQGTRNWVRKKGEGEEEEWHSHHLQQGQVAGAHIVKVDLDVLPPDLSKVLMHEGHTLGLVVDHVDRKVFLWCLIETVVVLARKQVDPHNTENQPKDEANQQHIHNGRDGTHQGVDYHLDQTKEDRIWQSENQETNIAKSFNPTNKTLHTVMALH